MSNFGGNPPMLGALQGQPQQAPRPGSTMPLIPRDRFINMLQDSYKRTGAAPDRRLLFVGTKQIDSHSG